MDGIKPSFWSELIGGKLISVRTLAIIGGLTLSLGLLVAKFVDSPQGYKQFGAEGDTACNFMIVAAAQLVGKSIYSGLSPNEAVNAITGAEMDAMLLSGMSDAQHHALSITISTLRLVTQGKEQMSLFDVFNKCSATIGTRVEPASST